MKDFLNSIAWIAFLASASFNSLGFGHFLLQYINTGNFILTDIAIRTLHIGSFFFVLYLTICLIRWYLLKKRK